MNSDNDLVDVSSLNDFNPLFHRFCIFFQGEEDTKGHVYTIEFYQELEDNNKIIVELDVYPNIPQSLFGHQFKRRMGPSSFRENNNNPRLICERKEKVIKYEKTSKWNQREGAKTVFLEVWNMVLIHKTTGRDRTEVTMITDMKTEEMKRYVEATRRNGEEASPIENRASVLTSLLRKQNT